MTDKSLLRFQNPSALPQPKGYSQVAEITGTGRIILISGQVPMDSTGAIVGAGDFQEQVKHAFTNLKHALEAAGGSFANVAKLNYYCVEAVPASELPLLREIRDQFVNVENPPASTFVFVSRLVRPEWLIEIEATAVIR